MDRCDLSWHLDRDRRFRSHHSVLFLGRNDGGDYFFRHQFNCPLSRRRIEIADHHPILVGVRSGNDLDRYHRRSRHLRTGTCVWFVRLAALCGDESIGARAFFVVMRRIRPAGDKAGIVPKMERLVPNRETLDLRVWMRQPCIIFVMSRLRDGIVCGTAPA